MFKIHIEDDELNNVDCMTISEKDDNGVQYTKKISYLAKSVRLSIDTLIKLQSCSKSANSLYILLLCKLVKDTNVVTISNKELKEITGYSDSVISRAKEELVNLGLIKLSKEYKYTYILPIDKAYKGNLNKIIHKYKEQQAELERIKEEEKANDSINFLNYKRKLKLNKNGSKD